MTNSASRKQARRFWGAMGAAMRQTSRLLDPRNQPRAETVIRRMNGLRATGAAPDVQPLTAR